MTFVRTHHVCPAPHQVPSLREKQRKNPTKEKSKRAAAPTWGGHWPSGRPAPGPHGGRLAGPAPGPHGGRLAGPAPGPHGGRLAYGLRAARLRTPLPTLVCSKTWPRNGVPGAEQHTRLCGGPGPILVPSWTLGPWVQRQKPSSDLPPGRPLTGRRSRGRVEPGSRERGAAWPSDQSVLGGHAHRQPRAFPGRPGPTSSRPPCKSRRLS